MLTNWIAPETLAELRTGFVVAIMLEAKDGEANAVLDIIRNITPPSMAEPGIKLFLTHRSRDNPSLFFIFELYVDEEAWKAHEATDHFKTWVPQLIAKVKRRERIPFVPFL